MTNDRHAGRLLRGLVLAVAASLLLVACSAATASVAPSVASAPPAPTATPTAAPTPSPTPADVSAAFLKIVSAPDFSAVGKIDGTISLGDLAGAITGDGLFDGDDSSGTTTLAVGATRQVTDSVTIGTKSWGRKSPGPWLETPPSDATTTGLNDYLRGLTDVVDLGVETYAGRPLHHLQPKAGNKVTGEELGFDVSGATNASFTADIYAEDDGTPAVLAIAGSWTQVSNGSPLTTAMSFDLVLSDVGKPQTIVAPKDVWLRYTSTANRYTMAHPADWTVKGAKGKDTYLLDDQPYVYVGLSAFKGTTPAFVTALKKVYKADFGDPVSENATRLGGQPAVRLLYQFTNNAKQDVTLVDDVLSWEGTGWEVFIATQGGAADIAIFDQFVATFEFTK